MGDVFIRMIKVEGLPPFPERDIAKDWIDIINRTIEDLGMEWHDRYGEESLKAAMFVSCDVPRNEIDEFSKECLARAAELRRAVMRKSSGS